MKASFFLLLIFLTGCSSSVNLREDLFRHWTQGNQNIEPFDAPYVSTFKRNGRTLVYIAANHENSIESKTFKTIKTVINQEDPDFIILEGFPHNQGISPEWHLKYSKKCQKIEFKKCGEPAYAAIIAAKMNIPYSGGEPTDKEVFEGLSGEGYKDLDVVGFYLLRQIPQLRRQGKLYDEDFKAKSEKYMAQFSKKLGLSSSITYQDFKAWYKGKSTLEKSYLDFKSSDAAPILYDKSTYFNKLSATVSLIREKFLNDLLEQKLNSHRKVLIVYGAGHLVKSRKIYEEYFGSSVDKKHD